MASIATCPQCARQLAVPEDATSTDHAECPLCQATFLLANIVRMSVPPARIISNADTPESAPSSAIPTLAELQADASSVQELASKQEESVEVSSEASTEEPVDEIVVPEPTSPESASLDSLPSWEARLKRAIEADASEMSSAISSEQSLTEEAQTEPELEKEVMSEAETYAPTSPASFEQPDFDQHLDTTEPETYSPESIDQSTEEQSSETPESSRLHETFEADIDEPELPARRTDISAEDAHAALNVDLLTNNRRHSQKRSWVKIAAATVTTGVVGSFLGLYTLLWLQGPQADYLGLASILPAAMLPTAETTLSEQSLAASSIPPTAPLEQPQTETAPTTNTLDDTQLADETPTVQPTESPLAATPLPSNDIQQDSAVQPATVEQPIPQPPATEKIAVEPPQPSISAEQFTQLVAEADASQAQFLAGDFSTPQSTARKGRAYMTLCQLAENFDFTHQAGLPPALQAEVATAGNIFDQLFNNPEAQSDLAKITSSWWGHSKRSNQGIFFTGIVQDAQPLGSKTFCVIKPGGQNALTTIPVLVDQTTVEVGSRIGVVGQIITQQDRQLVDLGLSVPQLVVSQYDSMLQ